MKSTKNTNERVSFDITRWLSTRESVEDVSGHKVEILKYLKDRMIIMYENSVVDTIFANEKQEFTLCGSLFFTSQTPPLPNPGDTVWVSDRDDKKWIEAIFVGLIEKVTALNTGYKYSVIEKSDISETSPGNMHRTSYMNMTVTKPDTYIELFIDGEQVLLTSEDIQNIKKHIIDKKQ